VERDYEGSQLRVAVVRNEELVAEAQGQFGKSGEGNIRSWKPIPSRAVKTTNNKF
jgi:hypothetical protein